MHFGSISQLMQAEVNRELSYRLGLSTAPMQLPQSAEHRHFPTAENHN